MPIFLHHLFRWKSVDAMSNAMKSEVVELVAQFQAQLKAGETDLKLQDLDEHYRQVFLWSERATTEEEHTQRLKKLRDAIARRQKVYVVTINYTTVESSSENALNNGTGVLDDWWEDDRDDDAFVSVEEFQLEEE
jgi:hypothetical protein